MYNIGIYVRSDLAASTCTDTRARESRCIRAAQQRVTSRPREKALNDVCEAATAREDATMIFSRAIVNESALRVCLVNARESEREREIDRDYPSLPTTNREIASNRALD